MTYTLKLLLGMWDGDGYESIDLAHFTHIPTLGDLIEGEDGYSFERNIYEDLLSSENKSVLVYDGAFQKDYITLVEIIED